MNNLTPQLTDMAIQSYYSHEEKYYNVNKYNKPVKYNNGNNFIKSYNVSDKVINNIKALYPINNATPYQSNIMNSINCYMLKIYITQTITHYKLFTDPKRLTAYCNSVAAQVKGFTCRHLFLVPEMNYNFTGKQIMRPVTQNKG